MRKLLLALLFFISTYQVFATPVDSITAFYRNGQVFVQWNNLSRVGVQYNLYRSAIPITSGKFLAVAQNLGWVPDSSSVNKRVTELSNGTVLSMLTIDSLGQPLPLSKGLFVATSTSNGSYYYVVTTTVNNIEDTTIIPGQNSTTTPISEVVKTPSPVLQQIRIAHGYPMLLYVQFLTNITTPNYPVMTTYGSVPVNFSVLETTGATRYACKVKLHGGGSNFLEDTASGEIFSGIWNIALDDWTPAWQGTAWIGYNQNDNVNLHKSTVPTSGEDLLLTKRRVQYTMQWVCRNMPLDSTKIIVYGASEGGIGTVFTTSSMPDKLATTYEYTGMFNLSFSNDPNGNIQLNTGGTQRLKMNDLFGTVATNFLDDEGLNLYTQSDADYMVRMNRDANYPVMFGLNGRNDEMVGWYEKIAYYDSVNANRIGGFYYWDNRTHGGGTKAWSINPNYQRYSTSISYPAFANCSANSNPGNGYLNSGDSIGTINGMLDWVDHMTDSATAWQITLYAKKGITYLYGTFHTPDSLTVDVTPRRLQNFKPLHGATIYYTNTHKGQVIQSGVASYDGNLIVIPQLKVYTDSVTLRLTINASSIDTEKSIPIQLTASKTSLCSLGPDTLRASGASTYTWTATPSAGFANIGMGPTIIVNPAVTTTYTVTGKNINGIKGTKSIVVTISSAPFTASVTNGSYVSFCQGSSVQLIASPTGSGYSYQWYGNNIPLKGATTPTYTASLSGTAYVVVTSSSSKGCPVTSNKVTVKQKPTPVATISVSGSNTIYQGDSARLSATSYPGYQFQWLRGNTVIGGATNSVYFAKSTGFYSCIVTDSGCSKTSSSIEIDSTGFVPISVTASYTTSCKGTPDTLKASGASLYQWTASPNFNIVGSAATLIVTPTITTTYVATGADTLGNQGSQSIVVTIAPAFTASVTPNGPTTFCTGNSVQLLASPTGGNYTYQWYGNNIKLNGATNSTYTANRTGTAFVVVTSVTNKYCASTSNSLKITQHPFPTANIYSSGSTSFCGDDSVELYVSTHPGYTFQWFDDSLLNLATNSIYYAKVTGNYYCAVSDSGCTKSTLDVSVNSNNCGTEDDEMSNPSNVADKMSVKQLVKEQTGFTVSPDPNNGNFYLSFSTTESGLNDFTMEVANLLGQIIYVQKGPLLLDGSFSGHISLPPTITNGCYLLRIVTGNTVLTQKVIVAK